MGGSIFYSKPDNEEIVHILPDLLGSAWCENVVHVFYLTKLEQSGYNMFKKKSHKKHLRLQDKNHAGFSS